MIDVIISGFMTVIGTVIGVILGVMLQSWNEQRKLSTATFTEIIFEYFKESVRISLRVEHEDGKLPISNALSHLTILVRGGELEKISVKKENDTCSMHYICNRCNEKPYLASAYGEISSEPLPWSIPLSAGKGLYNLRYKYLGYIPVNGANIIRIFDIYKVSRRTEKGVKEKFYLVKVHSEYGEIESPRICLKLPINNKPKFTNIIFTIRLAGENLKNKTETFIEIIPKEGDYILKYDSKQFALKDLLKSRRWLSRLYPSSIHVEDC